MNHVEKLVYSSFLSSGSVLIHNRMHGNARLNTRHDVANLSNRQGFDNC